MKILNGPTGINTCEGYAEFVNEKYEIRVARINKDQYWLKAKCQLLSEDYQWFLYENEHDAVQAATRLHGALDLLYVGLMSEVTESGVKPIKKI